MMGGFDARKTILEREREREFSPLSFRESVNKHFQSQWLVLRFGRQATHRQPSESAALPLGHGHPALQPTLGQVV